jgi:hypothetical protein
MSYQVRRASPRHLHDQRPVAESAHEPSALVVAVRPPFATTIGRLAWTLRFARCHTEQRAPRLRPPFFLLPADVCIEECQY